MWFLELYMFPLFTTVKKNRVYLKEVLIMTMSEKFEIAELIRTIVREELQRVLSENVCSSTTTTTTNSNENAEAYLKKISPMMKDYMSRFTLIDISHEMRSVLTDDEIKWVIIHLDSTEPYSKKNGKELSELLFK